MIVVVKAPSLQSSAFARVNGDGVAASCRWPTEVGDSGAGGAVSMAMNAAGTGDRRVRDRDNAAGRRTRPTSR